MTRLLHVIPAIAALGLAILVAGANPVHAHSRTTVAAAQSQSSRKDLYVTVRRYEGVTDPVAVATLVQEGFVPLISGIPGFVSYEWVDAGNGVIVATSTFTSRDAALASDRAAADWVAANIAPLIPNPPQITAGVVVISAP